MTIETSSGTYRVESTRGKGSKLGPFRVTKKTKAGKPAFINSVDYGVVTEIEFKSEMEAALWIKTEGRFS